MKKEKSKKTAWMMLFALCASLVQPVKVLAEDDYTYDFYMEYMGNTYEITSCSGTGESTVIPEYGPEYYSEYGYLIKEAPVSEVREGVFAYCENLKRIELLFTYERRIDGAFDGCTSLEEIVADEWSWYESQDGILYDEGKKTLLRCPEGKKGEAAVAEGTKCIAERAFYQCGQITSITIPKGVTEINDAAFSECSGLQDIYFACSQKEAAGIRIRSARYGSTYQIGESADSRGESIAETIREQKQYYYDLITGAMVKGYKTIDGVEYYFDEVTGIRR